MVTEFTGRVDEVLRGLDADKQKDLITQAVMALDSKLDAIWGTQVTQKERSNNTFFNFPTYNGPVEYFARRSVLLQRLSKVIAEGGKPTAESVTFEGAALVDRRSAAADNGIEPLVDSYLADLATLPKPWPGSVALTYFRNCQLGRLLPDAGAVLPQARCPSYK